MHSFLSTEFMVSTTFHAAEHLRNGTGCNAIENKKVPISDCNLLTSKIFIVEKPNCMKPAERFRQCYELEQYQNEFLFFKRYSEGRKIEEIFGRLDGDSEASNCAISKSHTEKKVFRARETIFWNIRPLKWGIEH